MMNVNVYNLALVKTKFARETFLDDPVLENALAYLAVIAELRRALRRQ